MSRGECLQREVFLPVSKGIFEGMEVNLPHNPDAYLKNLYGNYMQIPPVEKRERHFYTEIDLGPEFTIEK
nr:LicD family protein [uncultured Parabacteroides sp.]